MKANVHGKTHCSLIKQGKGYIFQAIHNSETDSDVVFCCVHLPSNPAEINDRNKCLKNAIEDINKFYPLPKGKQVQKEEDGIVKPPTIFIAGDMNYRTSTDKDVKDETARKEIIEFQCKEINFRKDSCSHIPNDNENCAACKRENEERCKKIKDIDQLNHFLETEGGKEYNLNEALITFCPTCRFDENDAARPYDNDRWPAFCDRVLYIGARIKTKEYRAKLISSRSDHNAVILEATI